MYDKEKHECQITESLKYRKQAEKRECQGGEQDKQLLSIFSAI